MNRYRTIVAAMLTALVLVLSACSGAAPSTGESTASSAPSVAASAATDDALASSAAASDDADDALASSAAASAADDALASSAAADDGASSSGLPLYTGATPLDPSSPMAAVLDGIKQQLEQQQSGVNVTVDLYNLPAGTTFEQVTQFYNDALTADGWTDATDQAQVPDMPGGGTAAWSRNNEAVAVLLIPDPTGAPFLVVSHATPQ